MRIMLFAAGLESKFFSIISFIFQTFQLNLSPFFRVF